ncbi:MAG: 2-oxoglutarate dehydrogenase E1 component [Gemmatimonadota bacterium]|jgi:2-oxoglutarate dehydrogenase E1 component
MTDDTLFDSQNEAYVQAMFEEYARNPDSVPAEWRDIFRSRKEEATAVETSPVPKAPTSAAPAAPSAPRTATPNGQKASPAVAPPPRGRPPARGADTSPAETVPASVLLGEPEGLPRPEPNATVPPVTDLPEEAHEHLRRALPMISRATALVQAFRDHGHQMARIDPLGGDPPGHPQLSPAFFGTSMEELAELPASLIRDDSEDGRSVADALAELGRMYAGSMGYEFEHLDDHIKVDWLWEQVENGTHFPRMDSDEKKALLERIHHVEGLEQFLHRAYLGQKRFSLEGTDMLVPMLDVAIEEFARTGAHEVVLGMAHRGRLNVLTHTVGVSYRELIAEFEGPSYKDSQLHVAGTGDVKYHHGARGTRQVDGVGPVDVTLAPNPSHLEFVNPVVIGWTRSRQFESISKGSQPDCDAVVPILIHGDAAFAAEGVVAETLNMVRLYGYHVGGTLHLIVNNQIGFTTLPKDGRSTYHASDLAKGYGIPIVHVNADDPEACLAAVRLATAYRRRFRDDFVIDLVGYRRYGHNEGDEPAYTQPRLYEAIDEHPTVGELYAEQLIEEGVVSEEEVADSKSALADSLRNVQDEVREYASNGDSGAHAEDEREAVFEPDTTGVDFERLNEINDATVQLPEGFTPHPKLWRQMGQRASVFSPNRAIDWGHAETLAFGTLLMEGIPVRLSGQDSQRGTFSHRHLVLHDTENGRQVIPLLQVADARLEIYNSPLTETAVLGFEYGYSVGADTDFVLWEAQFGDFVNVAQPIVDQFISSGRTKWGQYSRIALLLPHGYEGQGPEHSSARLERFLQLCAEDNIRVTYPTTPSQYFHLLRRQAMSRPERPLVVMTPKSLLRHPQATSMVTDLTQGAFEPVLGDPNVEDPGKITRLVLCSGKFYYDIQGHDRRPEAEHVAVGRVELLYPFPADRLTQLVESYPNLREVVWAQEEPRNMGALTYIGPRLRGVVPRKIPLSHASRPDRASPAEGKAKAHVRQQAALVLEALGLEAEDTASE